MENSRSPSTSAVSPLAQPQVATVKVQHPERLPPAGQTPEQTYGEMHSAAFAARIAEQEAAGFQILTENAGPEELRAKFESFAKATVHAAGHAKGESLAWLAQEFGRRADTIEKCQAFAKGMDQAVQAHHLDAATCRFILRGFVLGLRDTPIERKHGHSQPPSQIFGDNLTDQGLKAAWGVVVEVHRKAASARLDPKVRIAEIVQEYENESQAEAERAADLPAPVPVPVPVPARVEPSPPNARLAETGSATGKPQPTASAHVPARARPAAVTIPGPKQVLQEIGATDPMPRLEDVLVKALQAVEDSEPNARTDQEIVDLFRALTAQFGQQAVRTQALACIYGPLFDEARHPERLAALALALIPAEAPRTDHRSHEARILDSIHSSLPVEEGKASGFAYTLARMSVRLLGRELRAGRPEAQTAALQETLSTLQRNFPAPVAASLIEALQRGYQQDTRLGVSLRAGTARLGKLHDEIAAVQDRAHWIDNNNCVNAFTFLVGLAKGLPVGADTTELKIFVDRFRRRYPHIGPGDRTKLEAQINDELSPSRFARRKEPNVEALALLTSAYSRQEPRLSAAEFQVRQDGGAPGPS